MPSSGANGSDGDDADVHATASGGVFEASRARASCRQPARSPAVTVTMSVPDGEAARTAWQEALGILDDLGNLGAEAVRAKLKQ